MNVQNNKIATAEMAAIVEVQRIVEDDNSPTDEDIQSWVETTLDTEQRTHHGSDVELTIRIVDEAEISDLNQRYRQKTGSTNVLSFPVDEDLPLEVPLLGDLVICAGVVAREAQQQHKPLKQHWAHMVVHGTLHLLGYDHIDSEQATIMEQKEINILEKFGYANPYEVTTDS